MWAMFMLSAYSWRLQYKVFPKQTHAQAGTDPGRYFGEILGRVTLKNEGIYTCLLSQAFYTLEGHAHHFNTEPIRKMLHF